jgi:hypothetical protein
MLKTMLIAIVAAFAFAQAASAETPSAPAAPPAPPAAAATPAAPAAPAPVAPAPAAVQPVAPARREETEGNERPGIAARVKAFMTNNTGTAQLIAQVGTLTRERDDARTQLATLTRERDEARRELADVELALTGQQNIVKATATEIASTVGIPLANLPAPQVTGSEIDDLQDKLKGEQDAHKRSAIMAQIIAIRDGKK